MNYYKKINKDNRKKIAIISSTFPYVKRGGVPTFVENRGLYLSQKCKVCIFALGISNSGSLFFENNSEISIGNNRKFKFLFILYWFRLISYILKFKPDIIEIHNVPVAFPLFFLFKINYFFHGPFLYEAQAEKQNIIKLTIGTIFEYLAIKSSNKIYCISKVFQSLLIKTYKVNYQKVKLKNPKIKLENYYDKILEIKNSKNLTNNNRSLRLITIRRLVRRTGVQDLLQAYIYCYQNNILPYESTLEIIGDGPLYENINNEINFSNMKNNIKLLRNISNYERDKKIAFSDWNIVPTKSLEGFGLVVIEAGILGTPSLVTKVDALPYVIKNLNSYGEVCEKGVQGLINGLSNLYAYDTNYYKSLIKETKKFYFK